MGLFDGLFGKDKEIGKTDMQKNATEGIKALNETQMALGISFYEKGEYDLAFDAFKRVAENSDNSDAQYNLASLYAQGLGTEQNFMEAAYWFHKSNENGDEKADKLTTKSTLDYINYILKTCTPEEIYKKMIDFVKYVFMPDDAAKLANYELLQIGLHYCNDKNEYESAAKLFRAGAEFGDDGMCQNYLAVLYNSGSGVEKSDLASLYWFERASKQGVEAAKTDRDGMLKAYLDNLGVEETKEQLELLVDWCTNGNSEDVPLDKEMAMYWQSVIKSL